VSFGTARCLGFIKGSVAIIRTVDDTRISLFLLAKRYETKNLVSEGTKNLVIRRLQKHVKTCALDTAT
jgi:hypothetical protein